MAKRVVKKVAKKKAAPKKRVKRAEAGPPPEFMQMLAGALSQVTAAVGRAKALERALELRAVIPAAVERVIQDAETLRAYVEDGVVPGQAPEGAAPSESTDNGDDEPYVLTPAERSFGDTGGVRLGQ